jgi:hypothetical protein
MKGQVCFNTILLQKLNVKLYEFEKVNEAFEESKNVCHLMVEDEKNIG